MLDAHGLMPHMSIIRMIMIVVLVLMVSVRDPYDTGCIWAYGSSVH